MHEIDRQLNDQDITQAAASGQARHRFMSGSNDVSLQRVLAVVADFAEFHDCSMELVAWELNTSPLPVGRLWSAAIEQGLVDPTGRDPETDERTYTLSSAGWVMLGRTPVPRGSFRPRA